MAKTVELDFDEIVDTTYTQFGLEVAYHIDFGDSKEWLPASICHVDEAAKIVHVPVWLAEKKGLI